MRVLVTGAAGFVGKWLCPQLSKCGHEVVAVVRNKPTDPIEGAMSTFCLGDIRSCTDWSATLTGVDAIVHLAARTHTIEKDANDKETLFHEVNVEGTMKLAASAAAMGVRRFVYMSSVKAVAECSGVEPLNEAMRSIPENNYGITKLKAEKGLLRLAKKTKIEVIILRAPLIYGPGVKANMLNLIQACDKRLPLPLGSLFNKRSLIYLENLVDAIICLIEVKGLSEDIFFVSDGETVSTTELIKRIGAALGKSPRFIPCPIWALHLFGFLSGKSEMVNRLTGSLEVDDQKIRGKIGWIPPFNMKEGLEKTAFWYKNRENQE